MGASRLAVTPPSVSTQSCGTPPVWWVQLCHPPHTHRLPPEDLSAPLLVHIEGVQHQDHTRGGNGGTRDLTGKRLAKENGGDCSQSTTSKGAGTWQRVGAECAQLAERCEAKRAIEAESCLLHRAGWPVGRLTS